MSESENKENVENGKDNSKFELNEWNPRDLADNFEEQGTSMIVQGKTGSGKTQLVFNLVNKILTKKAKPDFIYIISNSEASLDEYKDNIESDEDTKVLYFQGYFNDLGPAIVKKIEKIHKFFADDGHIMKSLIIIDDAVNITKDRFNTALQDLFINGRKRNISTWYLNQSNKLSDIVWKDNVAFYISFGIPNSLSRKKFIDTTLDGLGNINKKDWEQIYLKYAHGHQAIIIDQTKNENDPKEIVKYIPENLFK